MFLCSSNKNISMIADLGLCSLRLRLRTIRIVPWLS